MNKVQTFFEVASVVGAILGAIVLIFGVASNQTMMMDVDSAAIAIALTVIPYCISATLSRSAARRMGEDREA